MTDTNAIAKEIEALRLQVAPLVLKIEQLNARLAKEKSLNFIELMGITPDLVAKSKDKDLPWFGDVWSFAKHLEKTRCEKPYAEWNGRIYLTGELIAGRMTDTPALADHIK